MDCGHQVISHLVEILIRIRSSLVGDSGWIGRLLALCSVIVFIVIIRRLGQGALEDGGTDIIAIGDELVHGTEKSFATKLRCDKKVIMEEKMAGVPAKNLNKRFYQIALVLFGLSIGNGRFLLLGNHVLIAILFFFNIAFSLSRGDGLRLVEGR
jgi:hypothetical protein